MAKLLQPTRSKRKWVGLLGSFWMGFPLLLAQEVSDPRVAVPRAAAQSPSEAILLAPDSPTEQRVDETIRFGVSLKTLHEEVRPHLGEAWWLGQRNAPTVTASGASIGSHAALAFRFGPPGLWASVRPVGASSQIVSLRIGEALVEAETLLFDAGTGLCLLRPKAAALPAGVGAPLDGESLGLVLAPSSAGVELGGVVFALNSPEAENVEPVVPGRLAGRDSDYRGEALPTSLLRVNVNLTEPTPGGPVLDASGRVVGVLTDRRLQHSGEHHAVPVELVEKLSRDHHSRGRTGLAWIGATFHLGSSTPQIVSVRPGSPVAVAGLQAGDVVMRIGDRQVSHYHDLVDACYYVSAGEETEVEVLRGLERLRYRFTPGFAADRLADADAGSRGTASEEVEAVEIEGEESP